MVCSLCYDDQAIEEDPSVEVALRDAIEKALRRGDTFTRYSGNQYLILLSTTQKENCDLIFGRIENGFYSGINNTNCWIEYDVTEVVEIPQNQYKSIKFRN